jgi:phenylacetate-CoA ligase
VSDPLQLQQWTLLQPLLQNALENSAFQRNRLLPVYKHIHSLESFVEKAPFTFKSELAADQTTHPLYGSNQTEPAGRYQRFCQTSGTTSQPLAIWDTEGSWNWLLENWLKGYKLAEVSPGMTAFFAFSFGPFLGFWTAFEAGLKMGLRCLPGGGLGTAARLHAILQHRVEVLCCTPTYALHLAEAADQAGIDLSKSLVRRILLAGEPGGSLPSVRSQLAKAWPAADILDHYGMTEVGPVAFAACGSQNTLRVLEARYFAEIIDTSGRAVPDGEIGELVLTPLGRSSWPLFRYRTGDLVRPRRSPAGLELVGGILGRLDDMVIVRGVNVFPSAVEEVVRQTLGALEYRVSVSSGPGLSEISVEIESSALPDAARLLEAAFERAFSLRIPVREVTAGSLPKFEMKSRRWLRS